MSKNSKQLTLVIPHLLYDPRLWSVLKGDIRPLMESLERFFSRANKTAIRTDNYQLLGMEQSAPAAASYAWDSEVTDKWVMRVDPIHLEPGRQGLVLVESAGLGLSQSDALTLVAGINQLLAEDGLQIEAPAPNRWYLISDKPLDIRTYPLAEAVGKNIDPFLPQGEQAPYWHRLMNELQMYLHTQPINQQREARGQMAVNSLWFWGEGKLASCQPTEWRQVWSDNAETLGLAIAQNIEADTLPNDGDALVARLAEGNALLELLPPTESTELHPEVWLPWLVELEEQWLAPLLDAVEKGELNQLILLPGNGHRYSLTRGNLRRWWRRQRPLERQL